MNFSGAYANMSCGKPRLTSRWILFIHRRHEVQFSSYVLAGQPWNVCIPTTPLTEREFSHGFFSIYFSIEGMNEPQAIWKLNNWKVSDKGVLLMGQATWPILWVMTWKVQSYPQPRAGDVILTFCLPGHSAVMVERAGQVVIGIDCTDFRSLRKKGRARTSTYISRLPVRSVVPVC